MIHNKREPPRNKNALRRQESFNVVSRREFNLAFNPGMPGPASYDLDVNSKPTVNIAKLTDKRWKSIKDTKPGPADYELSPMFQDTLLKGTFNATLNNPLVMKSQKTASDPALISSRNNKLTFNSLEKVNQTLKVA